MLEDTSLLWKNSLEMANCNFCRVHKWQNYPVNRGQCEALYSIALNLSLRLGQFSDIEAFQGSLGNIQSDLALVRQKLPAFVRNNGDSPI
jgi:hypothetical protein